ncbi:MAG TPA: phage holin family protein [Acidothermaceae bacterium]
MTTPLGERSLGELVATLTRDLALLLHQEIELIKADLVASLKKIAKGAAGFAIAAVLALFALPIISIAIALGVHALGVSLGWSFLIVAGGYLVLAAIAALVGVVMLRRAKPSNRAMTSVKADLHAIARKPGSNR